MAEPTAAVPAIRRAVYSVDATQPVFSIRTMRDVLDVATFDQRLISAMMAVFALIALLLAAVGVYGVMAYAVSQRTPELGIRIAPGARRASIQSSRCASSRRRVARSHDGSSGKGWQS